ALSYIWGSKGNPLNIELNSTQTLGTRNLHAALKRLRLPDKPRILWVDAICINQTNMVEKGHQVSLMGEIYSKTSCGIIFFGEEPEQLGFNETLEERRQLQSFFTGSPSPGLEAYHSEAIRALKWLGERPWWKRIWTVQE
ncbi:heterokaryon incompatibility, partial [Zopfia rhizophila CBS 207.26]